MRNLLVIMSVGFCLTASAAATSCVVAGYEGNLARPLAGTYAEKTFDLSGRIEGPTSSAEDSSFGLFDSLVKFQRDSEPGPLCTLRVGFLLFLK